MKFISIVACIFIYFFVARAIIMAIRQLGVRKGVQQTRIQYLTKTANIGCFVLFLIILCLVMGLGEVSVFLSSVFAVIGVALFAQWSLLSNITASMVIFFGFPYRIGDKIKVTDADFDLSGVVEEISLFHVLIRTDSGNIITYPNSLILQKPVIKLDQGNTKFPEKLFPPSKAAANRSQDRKNSPLPKRSLS